MSKRKKLLIIVGSITLVLLLSVGSYALYMYNQVSDTVAKMYEPLERDVIQKELIKDTMEKKEPINVLLLGVDEREYDKGRSDTMIFASLNPNTNKILMFSIPRDTYVTIPGRGEDKINHAYAFGGTDLAVETVEDFLKTDIHFYTKVNMQGFKDGVDAVGGVTVKNDFEFNQGGEVFPAGEIHLDGDQALKYARMRKHDPDNDFGRTERQREVLKAALDKTLSFESFAKVNDLLNTVGDNVKTNMAMDDMRGLFTKYQNTRKDIVTEHVSGYGEFIGDIWYLMLEDEEVNRLRDRVENHLNKG
ncbi:LCP family glycopolymer transferase [Piscibacillus sp. B03]|uniref:LCP family glycopolymer transferase n=1 Tax=Piscibacillus sp. B03 TaxID=3457430 RepID=UPI003FCD8505